MDNLTDNVSKFAQARDRGVVAPESGEDIGLPEISAGSSEVESILVIVFGAAAAVAVLVIVIASLNIATGGGDPEKISRGKKTIILALVGLAIALTAEFIVLTILNRI